MGPSVGALVGDTVGISVGSSLDICVGVSVGGIVGSCRVNTSCRGSVGIWVGRWVGWAVFVNSIATTKTMVCEVVVQLFKYVRIYVLKFFSAFRDLIYLVLVQTSYILPRICDLCRIA